MNKQLELYSPFPPDECARRLSSAIDPAALSWHSKSQCQVAGRINGAFLLLGKRTTFYGYPDKPVFTGNMQPCGTGAIIRGKFAPHIFNRVLSIVWYVLWSAFLILLLIAIFAHLSQINPASVLFDFLKGPAEIILLTVALEFLNRFLARGEARFLTDFLRQTLDARDDKGLSN